MGGRIEFGISGSRKRTHLRMLGREGDPRITQLEHDVNSLELLLKHAFGLGDVAGIPAHTVGKWESGFRGFRRA